jgi:hypothetical protein
MIKKGDEVKIKPEWQDPGDSEFTWVAIEDQDGDRVRIAPTNTGMRLAPQYVIDVSKLEA